jgi:hypothetical protein
MELFSFGCVKTLFTQPFSISFILIKTFIAMKTSLLSFILIFVCIAAFAQKDMDDVVYLKNGSRIQGSIMMVIPDSIVQIKQQGGSVWVFSMKEVTMIDKEEKVKQHLMVGESKGYKVAMEVGALFGAKSNEDKTPIGLQMVHSYHFTPKTAIGLGAGLEFYHTTQIPLFVDLRYYFNRKYYAPFCFLEGGTMIPAGKKWTDNYGYSYKGKIGYMINPGLGFLLPSNEKMDFFFSFSYRYQELFFSRQDSYIEDYTRIEKMNRFKLSIGLILK